MQLIYILADFDFGFFDLGILIDILEGTRTFCICQELELLAIDNNPHSLQFYWAHQDFRYSVKALQNGSSRYKRNHLHLLHNYLHILMRNQYS